MVNKITFQVTSYFRYWIFVYIIKMATGTSMGMPFKSRINVFSLDHWIFGAQSKYSNTVHLTPQRLLI